MGIQTGGIQMSFMDYNAQIELEIEYNSAFDDHHERYAGEALDAQYEAECDDEMLAAEYPDEFGPEALRLKAIAKTEADAIRASMVAADDSEPPF
jgi:hypothetical protein